LKDYINLSDLLDYLINQECDNLYVEILSSKYDNPLKKGNVLAQWATIYNKEDNWTKYELIIYSTHIEFVKNRDLPSIISYNVNN